MTTATPSAAADSADRRDALWLPLLRRLTAAIPDWVVLKNSAAALRGIGDIDSFAGPEWWPVIEREFRAWAAEHDLRFVMTCRHIWRGPHFVAADRDSPHLLVLDVKSLRTFRGMRAVTVDDAVSLSELDPLGFRRLRPGAEGVLKLLWNGMRRGGRRNDEGLQAKGVLELLRQDPEGAAEAARIAGLAAPLLRRATRQAAAGRWSRPALVGVELWCFLRGLRRPDVIARQLRFRWWSVRRCDLLTLTRRTRRRLPPDRDRWLDEASRKHRDHQFVAGPVRDPDARGRSIVILGPDGAGKTHLADALAERLSETQLVARAHGSPRVLPRRRSGIAPVTEPHAQLEYPRFASVAKLAYLFVDMSLSWRVAIPRLTGRGTWAIVERGWWDIAIDPRRYRLRRGRLAARLGTLLPAADLTVVLAADPQLLYSRKPELSIDELARQIAVAKAMLPASDRVVHLDASRPIAELVDAILVHLESRHVTTQPGVAAAAPDASCSPQAWSRLPSGRSGRRIVLARSPRRIARAGLRVYHPVTRRGYVSWAVLSEALRFGGSHLLPAAEHPPELRLLEPILPPGTRYSVATSRHRSRSSAVCIDERGNLIGLAKLATDDIGRARLKREATMARTLAPHLESPLSSPRILADGEGFVLFEAVPWRPRWNASELSPNVAQAMGLLFKAGARSGDALGYAHGDFAPWNLLRTNRGWSLIDWADARDDAPPFHDLFHFLVQAGALLGRPRRRDLRAALTGAGTTRPAFVAYAEASGVPVSLATSFLPLYLRTSSNELQPGRDQERGLAVRRDLLRELESSFD